MEQINKTERNWAGNYEYHAKRLHYPESIEQAQEIVRISDKLKALGSRHSFNHIADSPEDLISLDKFEPLMVLGPEQNQVTISANVKYGQLAPFLHQRGYGLHNLASLPQISVVGACATATHGSGVRNGNLATAVSALELITADGSVKQFSRQHHNETFPGAVVALGGLGLITKITLDLLSTYDIRQTVYENLPFSQLENHLHDIMSSAYSVSLFTNWQDDYINQIWVKQLSTEEQPEPMLFGAAQAAADRHPIPGISAENCTSQMSIPGPWHTRLPHFRMEFTPSSGAELQTEYFVPRHQAYPALMAVNSLRHKIAPLLQTSEIRTIAADDLWLSPCFQQDSLAIHFTWKPDWQTVRDLLPEIETALIPFNVRPHWAKLFTLSPTHLQSQFHQLPKFQQLLNDYDPTGKFRNEFLDTYIFG